MTTATAVQGQCPLGHGQSLRLEDDGRIMCGDPFCERPYAVTELLTDPPAEHLVHFEGKEFFTAQHPLRERLDRGMFACTLPDYLSQLHGDPAPPGFYRFVLVDDVWTWGIPVTADTPPLPEPEPSGDEPLPVAEAIEAEPACICGPDSTGEAPDERPDCAVHGIDAEWGQEHDDEDPLAVPEATP